jgi:hypothetical protein
MVCNYPCFKGSDPPGFPQRWHRWQWMILYGESDIQNRTLALHQRCISKIPGKWRPIQFSIHLVLVSPKKIAASQLSYLGTAIGLFWPKKNIFFLLFPFLTFLKCAKRLISWCWVTDFYNKLCFLTKQILCKASMAQCNYHQQAVIKLDFRPLQFFSSVSV